MRESLRIAEKPTDVNSAKQLIQEHEEKWEDIQTHNDRYSSKLINLRWQVESPGNLITPPPTTKTRPLESHCKSARYERYTTIVETVFFEE